MKIDAVGISSANFKKTVHFYSLLGFQFPEFKEGEQHIESAMPGSARLMIDSKEMIKSIIGEDPHPSNHSPFAIEYNSASEVDEAADKVKKAGFKVIKEPWDAFWGQRYAIVEDPDGYRVDLYARL
jgi:uncharacterized glyoxalase superfamily protein PhnB